MRTFVDQVLAQLARKGFATRVEVEPFALTHPSRVHVFARTPSGLERAVTIDVQSDAWAHSLAGNPMNPADVAQALVRAPRRRSP